MNLPKMPENLSEWMGVCAFFLVAFSLLIHWLQYRHQKNVHKEETEEQVDVRLKVQYAVNDISSPLIATVVNTGRTQVHLDRVELVCGPQAPRTGQSITSIPLPCTVLVNSVVEPGDKREYFLPSNHPLLSKFAAANPDELRLVIYSNRGEIARVDGKDVAHYLRDAPGRA